MSDLPELVTFTPLCNASYLSISDSQYSNAVYTGEEYACIVNITYSLPVPPCSLIKEEDELPFTCLKDFNPFYPESSALAISSAVNSCFDSVPGSFNLALNNSADLVTLSISVAHSTCRVNA